MCKRKRHSPSAPGLRGGDKPDAGLRRAVLWCGTALLLAAWPTPAARAQISPGPLARAHQSLDGPANCTKCHAVSTRTANFRCLECHEAIAAELRSGKGLHATFPQGSAPGAACVKCHSDHNGVNFTLVHWDPTPRGFDHTKTGYALEGKHAALTCRACHNLSHISMDARQGLRNTDFNATFLGLTERCAACHEDKHQGRFGADCAHCHSTAEWKTARIDTQGFDHTKTRFRLTGMHLTTPCQKCHTAGADGQPRYTGLKFDTCAACHNDPHKGEFKQDCSSCHTTATWKKSAFVSTFDHSKTAFRLEGKHTEVGCLTCHKGGDFKAQIAHGQCMDCHRTDPHGGQFLSRADGGRCESCHTVQGWKPALFSVADHAKTGFPLVAPHALVTCAGCHKPAGAQTRYKIRFALCTDCHEDAHKGQFAAEPWRNRCERCHTGPTFKKQNYTIALHQKTGFPLTGGHIAVACNECHKPMGGSSEARFHFSQLSCITCHEDVHRGQFAARMAAPGPAGKPLGCEACHTTKEWQDVAKFDHSGTRFALEGSHRAVACAECHRPPNMERTMRHVDFDKAPMKCSECHENPHADQFGARGADCASCHNSNKWKPSLFDHEKTSFPLKGGHMGVRCASCHTNKRDIAGNSVLFYKPTPTACAACHGANVPKAEILLPSASQAPAGNRGAR